MTKLRNMTRSGVPALRRSTWPFADETGRKKPNSHRYRQLLDDAANLAAARAKAVRLDSPDCAPTPPLVKNSKPG